MHDVRYPRRRWAVSDTIVLIAAVVAFVAACGERAPAGRDDPAASRTPSLKMSASLRHAAGAAAAASFEVLGTAHAQSSAPAPTAVAPAAAGDTPSAQSVTLNDSQLRTVRVEPIAKRLFALQREAVGAIAFNDEKSVPVFPPFQGRILAVMVKAGDRVRRGQTLFTIDSPDLVQAESTLITTAGVRELTTRVLERARALQPLQGVAEKDLQQAISDQQSAEAAFKSAVAAVRIFGKTDAEIDRIVADRRVDRALVVPSPIDGVVAVRIAAPGLFVQPGTAPAPITVADVSNVWMIANVAESEIPLLRVGQPVAVRVMAYPGRTFRGAVTNIAAMVDPNLHRIAVRSEVLDPKRELRPGMFANFSITTGDPVASLAVPPGAVVREGDGTMTVWVTTDRRRFTKRTVKIGLRQGIGDQVLEGVREGELVATEGALFLSNALLTSVR